MGSGGYRPKVKVCGLTNLSDALAAAKMGADFLGFVFAASPRQITLEKAERFWHDLPSGVPRVGVFKDQKAREVGRIVDRLPFGYLQFHGSESPAVCRSFGLPVIRAVSAGEVRDLRVLELYKDLADYYLVDLPKEKGGAGVLPREIAAAAVKLGKPTFLAGGFRPKNIAEIVGQLRPYGVDVARGVEKEPGRKDIARMRRFFEQLRQASDTIGKGVGR